MAQLAESPTRLQFNSRELDTLRPALDPRFSHLPIQELWTALDAELRRTLQSEDIESFWNQVGHVLSGAAAGAAPGAAMGAAAGPYGALIGAGLGALTGGIRSATSTPSPAQPPRRATTAPSATPVPQPAAPVASPTVGTVTATTAQPPTAATSAQTPATAMLLDPQILGALAQALLPVLLQQLGRRDGVALGVRAVQVSPLAALDALRTLVDRARVEVEGQLGPDAGHAAHLRNLLGDFMAEPSSADARAARVVELAHETRAMLGGPSSAPDIVTPLPGSPSNVVRFRRGVTNTRAFPHSAICQLRMQMSDGGDAWFIGTGFYVADGLILTAGHNVLHRRYGRATRLVVTPGRQSMLVRPFGSFEVAPAQMHTHPRWNRTASRADFDLAVLAVRTAPPLGRYFPMATEALSASQRLTVCGYAASESDGVDPNEQNLDEDYVRARTANTVTYGLNTTGGTSGSPAYTELEGRPCVVSVHSRTHDEHTNQGCRLTADKLAWIRGLSRSVPDHLEPRSFVDPQILHVLDEPGGEEPLRFDASDPLSSLYALQYGRRDLATELLLGGEA